MAIEVYTDPSVVNNGRTLQWTIPVLAVGDVITVRSMTWDTGVTLANPSGTGLAFGSPLVLNPGTGSRDFMGIWAMKATAGGTSVVVSQTVSASAMHTGVLKRYPAADGYDLAVTPNVLAPGSVAASGSITGTAGNVADVGVSDWNGADGAARVWTPAVGSGTTEDLYARSAGDSTHYYAYVVLTGPSTTVGLSSPTGTNFSVGAVEILATGGGGGPAAPDTVAANWLLRPPGRISPAGQWNPAPAITDDTTAQTVTGTASLTLGASGAASADTAGTASLTLGASGSAAGATSGSGSLTLSASGGAAGAVSGSGSLTLGASGNAAAGGNAASGTASITLGASGAAAAASTGTASLTLGASGAGAGAATGTASLTLGASGAARAATSGSGSITLGASGAGAAPVAGSGSITLGASGDAGGSRTGTASITLGASGSVTVPITGSGSLTFGGSGIAGVARSGTGSITLTASGSGSAVVVSTASITLNAAGVIAATAGGTASIVLTAAGSAVDPNATFYDLVAVMDPPALTARTDPPELRATVDPPLYVSRA